MTKETKLVIETGGCPVSVRITPEMIEEVRSEYETDNPGRTYRAMSKIEFGKRLMEKALKSIRYEADAQDTQ